MNTIKNAFSAGLPRERASWIGIIDQSLALYGHQLTDSDMATRLIDHWQGSESIDQAGCTVLWDEALSLSGDALFALHCCSRRTDLPLPLQMLELTAAASTDLGAALAQVVRFFSLISTQAEIDMQHSSSRVILLLKPVGQPHPQQLDALLGLLAGQIERFVGVIGQASGGLALQSPRANEIERAGIPWCDAVRSSTQYALSLPSSWLRLPLPSATPGMLGGMTGVLRSLQASMSAGDVVSQVRQDIQHRLGTGPVNEEQIAEPLKVSTRHLRRLLRQHNTSYEQLLDQARREESLRLLADPQKSLTGISYEVGFLDPSSFTRAFRRWTGLSPRDYRRRIGRGEDRCFGVPADNQQGLRYQA
ncbi:MAG: hypothetical protein CVV07_12510 [Gammaproteobacteria bacterium HGW-Gammaproteobacteria-11]|nr:MAG: hypothetical protein CVV07_12510 [Gammaproteobacteria bacterium HGW-Gammaproteobacteria-11]